MYNHLTQTTADYGFVLDIPNHDVQPITGSKPQIRHQFLDGRSAVVELDADSKFDVDITFKHLSSDNKDKLLEFYANSTKAYGGENSFYWYNYKDGYIYVVKFLSPLRLIFKPGTRKLAETIRLRVTGYYREMIPLQDSTGTQLQDSAGNELYVRTA
jgi:hypothetical protein